MTQQIIPLSEPITDPETQDKVIRVRISNRAVRFLNSVVLAYNNKRLGDEDDKKQIILGEELRTDILALWRILNPS